jgi:hypothetical protein
MVVRWSFYDPITLVSYEFEVNPREGGTPGRRKNITSQTTSASDGQAIIMEGAREPMTYEFSGTLLTEDQYNTFLEWFDLARQIQVTDDLGRQFWIFITEFSPKRERAIHFPWKHSYSIKATILDVAA